MPLTVLLRCLLCESGAYEAHDDLKLIRLVSLSFSVQVALPIQTVLLFFQGVPDILMMVHLIGFLSKNPVQAYRHIA